MVYQITNFQPLISLFVEVDLFNTRGRPPLPLMACSAAFRSRRGGRLPSAIIAAAARRPRQGAVARHAGIARPDHPPVLRLGKATARRFRARQQRPKTSLRSRTDDDDDGASRVTMASDPGRLLGGAKESISIRLGGNSREACESVSPDAYPHRARQPQGTGDCLLEEVTFRRSIVGHGQLRSSDFRGG